ncbi:MAG: hypothetical protein K0R43_1175 [Pseudoduganella sp.]|jgi:hypothetical protein|nr:hypothetical protein [Pseudoduganella sp.]
MFETMEFEWRPRAGRVQGRMQGRTQGRVPLQGRPRAKPGRRPRRGPVPVFNAWPYGVPVFEPLPIGGAEPVDEPFDEPIEEPFEEALEGELTQALREAVNWMTPGMRPKFEPVGSLRTAPNHPSARNPGLYYFEFGVNGRTRAYSGESAYMANRLKQHRLCAAVMGLRPESIRTFVAVGPVDYKLRRAMEKQLHERVFDKKANFLTNQNLELEFDMFEEEHRGSCGCARCQRGPFSEEQELELAMELLSVQSEADLEQFLGKMFKGIWRGIKKVAKPLGGVLKGIAKKALPFVGGALGSFIPIPGVGTALGSALGGALSKALEMEMQEMPGVDRELEVARRFVRIAGSAARAAGDSDGSAQAVRRAVLEALRANAPRFGRP